MFLGCLAEDVLVLHKHFLITTAIITSSNTPPEAEAPILTQFDGLFCGAAVTSSPGVVLVNWTTCGITIQRKKGI